MMSSDTLREQVAEAIITAIWPEGRTDLHDLGQKASAAVLPLVIARVEALRENGRLIYMDDAILRGYAACLDDVLDAMSGGE